jgi:hypothetical protein
MSTLTDKLNPRRFPNMSGKMAAVLGCILGQQWSRPRIAELLVTSDGWVLARDIGRVRFENIIGRVADLERNWETLLHAAGLTSEERQEAGVRYRQAVRDYRRPRVPCPAVRRRRLGCISGVQGERPATKRTKPWD